jgi:uncharacterized small protein (DUF1192 family)
LTATVPSAVCGDKLSNDPNIPPGAPAVLPEPRPTPGRKITCAYCECVLADDGGVLRTSERVKALNKQEERIETLKSEIERLERDLTAARDQVSTLTAQIQAASRPDDSDPWR